MEQASPADMFHNGAFRLSYGFEYAAMSATGTTRLRQEAPIEIKL
jgi:hypothetical protein